MDREKRKSAATGGRGNLAAGSAHIPSGGGQLADGPEFDLIREFVRGSAGDGGSVRVGIGDDAAVVTGEGIVLSSDLSIEGIHFRREWIDPVDIGYRAAMAALSDLAAMAARPIGLLASVAFARGDAEAMGPAVMAGVREAVESLGGQLLGGDLTSSPGPIILDITVVGDAPKPVLRSGGKAGDELWVTGVLGGSALAVRELLAGRTPASEAMERYRRPIARTAEILWLAGRSEISAMVDLSDGIAGDAAHLARSSGVRVDLNRGDLPVSPFLESLAADDRLQLALRGGEDYEILFAAPPGLIDPLHSDFVRQFGVELTRIGSLAAGDGVWLSDDGGGNQRLEGGGYQHFQGAP